MKKSNIIAGAGFLLLGLSPSAIYAETPDFSDTFPGTPVSVPWTPNGTGYMETGTLREGNATKGGPGVGDEDFICFQNRNYFTSFQISIDPAGSGSFGNANGDVLDYEILNSAGSVVFSGTGGSGVLTETVSTTPGQYHYIRVHDKNGQITSNAGNAPYELEIVGFGGRYVDPNAGGSSAGGASAVDSALKTKLENKIKKLKKKAKSATAAKAAKLKKKIKKLQKKLKAL